MTHPVGCGFPALLQSAVGGQTFVDYYDVFTVGAGYLDLGAAMALAHTMPAAGSAMSPTPAYDASTGDVSLQFDPSSIWSDRSMWGAQSMWGADIGLIGEISPHASIQIFDPNSDKSLAAMRGFFDELTSLSPGNN